MRKLKSKIVDLFDCAGPVGDKEGPRICAASSSSYFNQSSWTIFLSSSAIKLQGKPSFAKKSIEDEVKVNDEEDLNPDVSKVINYEKNKLKKEGGLIAKFLTNKIKGILDAGEKDDTSASEEIEEIEEKKDDSKIQTSNSKNLIISLLAKSKLMQSIIKNSVSIKVKVPSTLFAFYMISQKINANEIFHAKLGFKNYLSSVSIQSTGPSLGTTISSATVFNLNPDEETKVLGIRYKSSHEGKLESNGIDTNFFIGSVLLPKTDIYKTYSMNNIELEPTSENFKVFGDKFKLYLKNDKYYDQHYLVFSNTSLKISGSGIFGTMMYFSTNRLILSPETMSINGPGNYVSTHSATVVTVKSNESLSVRLKYYYKGTSNIDANYNEELNTGVSLSSLLLPKNAYIQHIVPQKNIILSTKTWKSFGLNTNLTFIQKKKKLLIIYNFCIKTDNNDLSIRVKINSTHYPRSIISFKNSKYSSGQGYFVEDLSRGSYNIDLEFICDGCQGTLPAGNSTALQNKQVLSMTIIELN